MKCSSPTTSISGRARRSQGSKTNSRCARSAACDSSAIIAREDDPERLNERSPRSKRRNPLRGNLHGVTISPRPLRSVEANRGRRTSSISGRARRRQGQKSDLAARAPLHALVRRLALDQGALSGAQKCRQSMPGGSSTTVTPLKRPEVTRTRPQSLDSGVHSRQWPWPKTQ